MRMLLNRKTGRFLRQLGNDVLRPDHGVREKKPRRRFTLFAGPVRKDNKSSLIPHKDPIRHERQAIISVTHEIEISILKVSSGRFCQA